jgi:hypothetical protein
MVNKVINNIVNKVNKSHLVRLQFMHKCLYSLSNNMKHFLRSSVKINNIHLCYTYLICFQ